MIIWRKSSRTADQGDCVELSNDQRVRDSKDTTGPTLTLGVTGLRKLLADVKAGKHDR